MRIAIELFFERQRGRRNDFDPSILLAVKHTERPRLNVDGIAVRFQASANVDLNAVMRLERALSGKVCGHFEGDFTPVVRDDFVLLDGIQTLALGEVSPRPCASEFEKIGRDYGEFLLRKRTTK